MVDVFDQDQYHAHRDDPPDRLPRGWHAVKGNELAAEAARRAGAPGPFMPGQSGSEALLAGPRIQPGHSRAPDIAQPAGFSPDGMDGGAEPAQEPVDFSGTGGDGATPPSA